MSASAGRWRSTTWTTRPRPGSTTANVVSQAQRRHGRVPEGEGRQGDGEHQQVEGLVVIATDTETLATSPSREQRQQGRDRAEHRGRHVRRHDRRPHRRLHGHRAVRIGWSGNGQPHRSTGVPAPARCSARAGGRRADHPTDIDAARRSLRSTPNRLSRVRGSEVARSTANRRYDHHGPGVGATSV